MPCDLISSLSNTTGANIIHMQRGPAPIPGRSTKGRAQTPENIHAAPNGLERPATIATASKWAAEHDCGSVKAAIAVTRAAPGNATSTE